MRKFTRHIIALFILFSPGGKILADENIIDSLRQQLSLTADSNKIEILNDLSRAYWSISLDSSLKYAQNALEIAELYNNIKGIANAFNRMGNAEYLMSNYPRALEHYTRSLELRLEIDDPEGLLGSYNNLYLLNNMLGNKDTAIYYLNMAAKTSISMGNNAETAYYSAILGSVYSELYDFDNARINLEQALNIYTQLEDDEGIASTYNSMGGMYQRMSLFDNAQECFFKALPLYRRAGNMNGVASVKNNIGIIHKQLDNLDLALDYYYQSMEIYNQEGSLERGYASVLNNIGIIFFEKGEYETSLDYYKRALESYESMGDVQGIATASHNTGMLHARLGNYSEALKSYMRSVEINSSADNRFALANNYNNLGELYILQKDYNRAMEFLEEAIEMAIALNAKDIISENYLFQSTIYRETRQYEKALLSYELFDTFRDSIFTTDTGNKIAELQVRHQRENHISQIDLLQKDNDIQQLQIKKQRNLLLFLAGIAFMITFLVSLITGMARYKKRLNLVLMEKNMQLELANKELVESERNLQRLNATKDKFFSIIAHDLKNPFNALLGFSETLNQNFKDLSREQIYTYIDIIKKSATNLYRLLENLLEWSRNQTGSIQYKPEKFRLEEVAETGINTVIANAERKNITIRTNIRPDLTAFADKNLISTVIRNLVNNAIKFTHNNGEITISATEKEKFIEFSVSDNGIGIEAGEQKKLFNLGYNITTVGTNDEKGTGLGLVLCKEFVEKSGGELRVESEAGAGSTFTFTIPK